jgi:hypothetical protein
MFMTEEEVQVWVDDWGPGAGRTALARLVADGRLTPQSESLARAWLLKRRLLPDRRGTEAGNEGFRARFAKKPERRYTDAYGVWRLARPLIGLVVLVLLIFAFGPVLRQQDKVSPIDGAVLPQQQAEERAETRVPVPPAGTTGGGPARP